MLTVSPRTCPHCGSYGIVGIKRSRLRKLLRRPRLRRCIDCRHRFTERRRDTLGRLSATAAAAAPRPTERVGPGAPSGTGLALAATSNRWQAATNTPRRILLRADYNCFEPPHPQLLWTAVLAQPLPIAAIRPQRAPVCRELMWPGLYPVSLAAGGCVVAAGYRIAITSWF